MQFDRLHARLSDADQLRRDLNAAHSAKAAAEAELAALRERFANLGPADQIGAIKVELARASSEREHAREQRKRCNRLSQKRARSAPILKPPAR